MRSPSLKPTSPYMPPTFARDSFSTFLIFILPLFVLALVALYKEITLTTNTTTSTTGIANMANHNALNVFKKPLAVFSKEPLTGFYRDGYCRVGAEDGGNHAVAGMWVVEHVYDFLASDQTIKFCRRLLLFVFLLG